MQKVRTQMGRLSDHLREDAAKGAATKAQALLETPAEVLTGLLKAFGGYETNCEQAWRAKPGASR